MGKLRRQVGSSTFQQGTVARVELVPSYTGLADPASSACSLEQHSSPACGAPLDGHTPADPLAGCDCPALDNLSQHIPIQRVWESMEASMTDLGDHTVQGLALPPQHSWQAAYLLQAFDVGLQTGRAGPQLTVLLVQLLQPGIQNDAETHFLVIHLLGEREAECFGKRLLPNADSPALTYTSALGQNSSWTRTVKYTLGVGIISGLRVVTDTVQSPCGPFQLPLEAPAHHCSRFVTAHPPPPNTLVTKLWMQFSFSVSAPLGPLPGPHCP